MCNFIFSSEAANMGNFLTGVATVGAIIVGYYQLNLWRRQHISTKRSEVAGRALTGILRLLQALDYLTSVVIDSPKDELEEKGPFPKTYQQRKDQENRLKATADDLNNFFQIKNECEVYLSEEINEKVNDLWLLWVSTKVDIGIHFSFLDSGNTSHPTNIKTYNDTFGSDGKRKRELLAGELKGLLKPVARLDF